MSGVSGVDTVEDRRLEDDELIERAVRSDTAAYSALVERYQGIAFRTAYIVAGNSGEAEDAAQEAFLKAYRSLNRFRAGAPFKPWLLAIVANEARNRARSATRRSDLHLRAASSGPEGDVPSAEAAALAADERAKVVELLNGLEPEDRLVIALRYLMEMTEKEMAQVMRCRPGTVKSRLSRAMGRLRRRIATEAVDA